MIGPWVIEAVQAMIERAPRWPVGTWISEAAAARRRQSFSTRRPNRKIGDRMVRRELAFEAACSDRQSAFHDEPGAFHRPGSAKKPWPRGKAKRISAQRARQKQVRQ